jgi:hypothetical protein
VRTRAPAWALAVFVLWGSAAGAQGQCVNGTCDNGRTASAEPPPRDPFSRAGEARSSDSAPRDHVATSVRDLSLSQLVLVGTLVSGTREMALLSSPSGRTWIVGEGDVLQDAVVSRIGVGDVTFRWQPRGGAARARDVLVAVARSEGAQ